MLDTQTSAFRILVPLYFSWEYYCIFTLPGNGVKLQSLSQPGGVGEHNNSSGDPAGVNGDTKTTAGFVFVAVMKINYSFKRSLQGTDRLPAHQFRCEHPGHVRFLSLEQC